MEDGFYWARIDGDDPEVVEIISDKPEHQLFRSGDEHYYSTLDGAWIAPFDEPMNVVFLSAKLTPPDA